MDSSESGLGIGTTPAALIAHGINTTIIEIDAAVHRLAVEHFKLPKNHTAYIEDAVAFVRNEAIDLAEDVQSDHATSDDTTNVLSSQGKYDYIVHDVFTGGAEPIELFTETFIRGLYRLLKPNGVIAIVGNAFPRSNSPGTPSDCC